MTTLKVSLSFGGTDSSGFVLAIPANVHPMTIADGDMLRDGAWRFSIPRGTETIIEWPAHTLPEVAWVFRVWWAESGREQDFGPFTYSQITAPGVDSLADLVGTDIAEFIPESTLISRIETLEQTEIVAPSWASIIDKPTTFSPAPHGHDWSAITGKPATFSPAPHLHGAADLSGVVKSVNGTAPDGSGNVVVAASSGVLSGTGSPEAVVTATVGMEYRDTSATNGAVKWIKATGTGSTGWVVMFGDTGWRDVHTLLTNKAGNTLNNRLRVRRLPTAVEVWFARVAGTGQMTLALPLGWRLPTSLGPAFTNDVAWPLTYRDPGSDTGISVGHVGFLDAQTLYCRATSGFDNRGVHFTYPTSDPWPTGALFGTPA